MSGQLKTTCVDRAKMCNFYNGRAFEGAIKNVPVTDNDDDIIMAVMAAGLV